MQANDRRPPRQINCVRWQEQKSGHPVSVFGPFRRLSSAMACRSIDQYIAPKIEKALTSAREQGTLPVQHTKLGQNMRMVQIPPGWKDPRTAGWRCLTFNGNTLTGFRFFRYQLL